MTAPDQLVMPPTAEAIAAALAEYVAADAEYRAAAKRATAARSDVVALLRQFGIVGVTL
jgi:hypothetical protein